MKKLVRIATSRLRVRRPGWSEAAPTPHQHPQRILAHVHRLHRQPDPHGGQRRQHRSSARSTCTSQFACADARIWSVTFSPHSTAASRSVAGADSVTSTGTETASRRSRASAGNSEPQQSSDDFAAPCFAASFATDLGPCQRRPPIPACARAHDAWVMTR